MTVPMQRKVFFFVVGILITITSIAIVDSILSSITTSELGHNLIIYLDSILFLIGIVASGLICFQEMTGFKPGDQVVVSRDFFSDTQYYGIYIGKVDNLYSSVQIEDGRVMNFRTEKIMFDITKKVSGRHKR